MLLRMESEAEELLVLPKLEQLLKLFAEEESEYGELGGGGEISSSSTSQFLKAVPVSSPPYCQSFQLWHGLIFGPCSQATLRSISVPPTHPMISVPGLQI